MRRVLEAWLALRPRDYAYAMAVSAVVIMVGLSEGTWALFTITPRLVLSYMLVYAVFGVVFLLALAGADAVGSHRWRPYAIGCVAASLVCASIGYVLRATPLGEMLGLPVVAPLLAAYGAFFSPLFFGALTTFVYVRLRDHRRAARALREAQAAASEAQREAAAFEMRTAHEKLGPEKVIRTLRQIEALYESEPAVAVARLDALAAELRAAIPQAG